MHSDAVEVSVNPNKSTNDLADTIMWWAVGVTFFVGAFFGGLLTYIVIENREAKLRHEVYLESLHTDDFCEISQHEVLETGFPRESILFQNSVRDQRKYKIVLRRESANGDLFQEEVYTLKSDDSYGDIDLQPAFGIPVTIHIVDVTDFQDGSGRDRIRYAVTVRKE